MKGLDKRIPGTLQLTPPERRSDGHSETTHGIVRGSPKMVNGQLPLATGVTLTDNRGLAR
jgi:hypothetical protein